MSSHFRPLLAALLLSGLFLVLLSCGGSESTQPAEDELGTIHLDPNPDGIDAPWTVTSSSRFSQSGNGDHTLNDLVAGEYTVDWEDVSGYYSPDVETQTLAAGGYLTFECTYLQPGSIQIDVEPDYVGATWIVTGPDGYSESGFNDDSLADLAAGDYFIEWGDVAGWQSPENEDGTLVEGGTLVFHGIYTEYGEIEIDPDPDELDAPWVLSGPQEYSAAGQGDSTLSDLLPGEYNIAWGEVAGWTSPSSETEILAAGDDLTFQATYQEQGIVPTYFVQILAGTFMMGAPEDELCGATGERPYHEVTLTHGFFLQSTEVTNQHYKEMVQWAYDQGYVTATSSQLLDNLDGSTEPLLYMESSYCEIDFNDGVFTCVNPDFPINELTWYGAVAYCDWLSLQAGLPRAYNHSNWQCNAGNPYTAQGFRLPTEAEWEYACRAGTVTAFSNGPITDWNCEDPVLDEIGWYCGNSWYEGGGNIHKHAARGLIPNAWGLYDMHANVQEWCNDWWVDEYYQTSPGIDPVGPGNGTFRVTRGGYWSHYAQWCRSATRGRLKPGTEEIFLEMVGFRPARTDD